MQPCTKQLLTAFTADVHKASAKVKSELPGRADQAKSQAESYANQASSKLESTVRIQCLQYKTHANKGLID